VLLRFFSYHDSVTSIILFPRKDERVYKYIDFRYLNKASLKDNFGLPHINLLVDKRTGHRLLSFIDAYASYKLKKKKKIREKPPAPPNGVLSTKM